MKAFISYSVADNNEFIITLLSVKLREKHFVISTSQNFYSESIDWNTINDIATSMLFIGIITSKGIEKNRVIDEWKYAVNRNVPNLLLMEDSVQLSTQFNGNYIRFNRLKPQKAIDEINRRMTPQSPTSKNSDEILPWILGGAALLAIIGLLTTTAEKR